MKEIQIIFFLIVALALVYLVVNALVTRSVWVKGARTGFVNFKKFAHKRSREDEPLSFWGFFVFYLGALVWIVYLIFLLSNNLSR